jgi:hypothetical protein
MAIWAILARFVQILEQILWVECKIIKLNANMSLANIISPILQVFHKFG